MKIAKRVPAKVRSLYQMRTALVAFSGKRMPVMTKAVRRQYSKLKMATMGLRYGVFGEAARAEMLRVIEANRDGSIARATEALRRFGNAAASAGAQMHARSIRRDLSSFTKAIAEVDYSSLERRVAGRADGELVIVKGRRYGENTGREFVVSLLATQDALRSK